MATPFTERQRSLISHFLAGLLIAFVIFEAFSLACWLLIPVFPSIFLENKDPIVGAVLNAETGLFSSLQQLAPILLAVLLVTGGIGLLRLIPSFFKKRPRLVLRLSSSKKGVDVLAGLRSSLDDVFDPAGTSSRRWVLVLALSVLVVSCVALYPYLPGLNPNGRLVGADVPDYVGWLAEMGKNGTSSIFAQALFDLPSRPLSVALMYLGWKASGVSIGQFFQSLPLCLGLMLVLVAFFFARKAGFNSCAASFVALFTAFSFQVTVGMYGGFFSNWVCLIFLYLAWGFLFWSMTIGSWSLLSAATLFQACVLFAHVETWEMTIGIAAVFLVITFARSLVSKSGFLGVKMMLTFLVTSVVAGLSRNFALRSNFAFAEVTGLSQAHLSGPFVWEFWRILNRALLSEMGIAFANPVMLFLACVGGLVLAFDDRLVSRFLSACVVAVTVPFVFGDWVIQTRILYDLPIQVFAFLGLFVLLKLTGRLVGKRREAVVIKCLLLVLVVLVNVNYAFRCSFNLA
jgi:hypothetical protein